MRRRWLKTENFWNMGDLNDNDLVLHRCDIDTLLPGQWLNDQIIEYALRRLRNPGELGRNGTRAALVQTVPPATSQLFLHAPELSSSVARDLHLDISAGPILFCLNNPSDVSRPLSGTHWSALVLVTETRGARRQVRHLHYDSTCGGANDWIAERMSDTLKTVFGSLDAGLEHVDSFRGRQKNAHDCGVFLLAVAQAYVRGAGGGQDAVDQPVDGVNQATVDALRGRLWDEIQLDAI